MVLNDTFDCFVKRFIKQLKSFLQHQEIVFNGLCGHLMIPSASSKHFAVSIEGVQGQRVMPPQVVTTDPSQNVVCSLK